MSLAPLASIFGNTGIFYGVVLPLLTLLTFALLLIPSLAGSTRNAEGAAKAVYCYLAQFVGILLMTLGSLPTVYAVLAGTALPTPTYLALLGIFAAGGLTFLWHDALVQSIPAGVRGVPFSIYFFTLKFLGTLAILLSALTLLLVPTLVQTGLPPNFWVMPVTILLYGLLIAWFTRSQAGEWNIFTTTVQSPGRLASLRRKLAFTKGKKR